MREYRNEFPIHKKEKKKLPVVKIFFRGRKLCSTRLNSRSLDELKQTCRILLSQLGVGTNHICFYTISGCSSPATPKVQTKINSQKQFCDALVKAGKSEVLTLYLFKSSIAGALSTTRRTRNYLGHKENMTTVTTDFRSPSGHNRKTELRSLGDALCFARRGRQDVLNRRRKQLQYMVKMMRKYPDRAHVWLEKIRKRYQKDSRMLRILSRLSDSIFDHSQRPDHEFETAKKV